MQNSSIGQHDGRQLHLNRVAGAARCHWEIEALHRIRDLIMKKDAQRLRAGISGHVAAAIRNTAIAALRLVGFTSAAAGPR